MTDRHDMSAAPEPTSAGTPGRHVPAGLWVLLVLCGFLALAALWFALFGAPQTIGPEASAPAGVRVTGSTAGGSTAAGSGITPADVRSVLGQLDYAESNDTSATEYANMLKHVLAGVDVANFAQDALGAASTISWQAPGTYAPVNITGAEKRAIVAEAIAFYRSNEASAGEKAALDSMLSAWYSRPVQISRPDALREVVAQGLVPLGLMFGAQDADNQFAWHVLSATVTGPRSADVVYSASAMPRSGWRFVDPTVRYVKHLTFARGPSGRWRLAGWSNYSKMNQAFHSNVTPPSAAINLDEWWGGL
ncbi:MAG: hypothetical protein P4L93_01545 [Coriobacteriia bacterium]|nr:hypothetical protein [Coriobacteriia bacterium]